MGEYGLMSRDAVASVRALPITDIISHFYPYPTGYEDLSFFIIGLDEIIYLFLIVVVVGNENLMPNKSHLLFHPFMIANAWLWDCITLRSMQPLAATC